MINKELNELIKSEHNIDIAKDYLPKEYGNIVFCFDWTKKEDAEIKILRGLEIVRAKFGKDRIAFKEFFDYVVLDNPISDIYGEENFISNIKKDLSTLDIKYDLFVPINLNGTLYWNSFFLRSLSKINGENALIYGMVNYSTQKTPKAIKYYQNTFRDSDTRLYTKASLKLHIKQAKSSDHSYGLYFDIDNFKRINDVFGHKSGDGFLLELADAMRKDKTKTPNAQYYRMGGDEFFVYIKNCTEREAYCKAQDMIYIIETLNAHGQQVEVSASVGIVPIIGSDVDFDKMLDLADKTMYFSKGKGKGIISYARDV